MTEAIYKLHANEVGHPYLISGALPQGYTNHYFNGTALPESWIPQEVQIVRPKKKLPDIIAWKANLPLLSERAVEIFKSVAPSCAEYRLFTHIRDRPYFVLNVLAQVDIFDQGRSEFTLTADGRIRTVQTYAFTTMDVASPIFKLAGFLDGPNFVTREFAQAVVDAKLLGFEFRDPAVNETPLLFAGKNVNVFP